MTTSPSESADPREAAAAARTASRPPARVETARTAEAAAEPATGHHRRAEPGPLAGGGRRRGRLRHPGRGDPPALRPAVRLRRSGTSWSATSRAPGTPPPGTRRPPAGSASAWRPPARARPTWSPRWPTPTWTRCRSWRSPARCPAARSAPTPSRRPTSAASRCRSPSTTSWSPTPTRSRSGSPRRSTWPRTGRPGPVLVDIPKDVLQATHRLQLAAADGPARLPADHPAARQAGARGRRADRRRPPAGALRRRRRAQGRRHRGAGRAGRADRRSRSSPR